MKSRLSKYSALAATIIAGASTEAQVVYTDVNPDVELGETRFRFPINFNGDRFNEFVVKQIVSSYTSSYTSIYNYIIPAPYGSGGYVAYEVQELGSYYSTYYFALNLAAGDQIGSQLYFGTSAYATSYWYLAALFQSASSSMRGGNFLGKTGYAPVKFILEGNVHYGWIRLSVSADARIVTIHDFAYESTPGKSIDAGQKQ